MHTKMGINFSLDLVRLFCSQFKTIFAKIKTGERFLYVVFECYHTSLRQNFMVLRSTQKGVHWRVYH